jgi:hypothetical protein
VNRWHILLRKTVNKSATRRLSQAYAQNVHNFGLLLFTSPTNGIGAPLNHLRDYVKIAVFIWHDENQEPGAPRFGLYFDTVEEATATFEQYSQALPSLGKDLLDFRWFGFNKKSIIAAMNLAYAQFFNYQLFIDGYDGLGLETTDGRGLAIFVESPRSSGFNSISEE